MDLIELAPLGGQPASDFLAAKLIYKCLGYLQEKRKLGLRGSAGGLIRDPDDRGAQAPQPARRVDGLRA